MDERLQELILTKMDKIDEIHADLREHIGWEEAYHKEVSKDIKEIKTDVKGHNERIARLEMWREGIMGKVAGISIGLSVVTSMIVWIMKIKGVL